MKVYQVRARAHVVAGSGGSHLRLDVSASLTVRASSANEARQKAVELLAERQNVGTLLPDEGLAFDATSALVVQVA